MRALLTRLNSLSIRIPLLLIGGAFVAALAVGVNSHIQSSRSLIKKDMETADNTARFRATVLNRIGEGFATDLRIMADAPTIREAYDFLSGVYDNRATKDDALRRHYTERKPPSGQTRADYLGEEDRSTYAIGHKRWHPLLRSMARDKKLYDLFLISPTGEVIYTVEKEADFATNLRTGPWRATGLARAFEGA